LVLPLGPLVSQISFGLDLPITYSLPAGIAAGLLAGFCLPPLANHFVKFHQGFNLYNIGFTAGITGMFFMAMLRAFDFQNPATLLVAEGYNKVLSTYLMVIFTVMLLIGLFFSRRVLPGLIRIWRQSGRLVSDFVTTDGFGPAMVNMSLLGFISTYYVLLVGGQLNGPIIGGIFTIVGFGAFGKHVKNTLPLLAGVYLAAAFPDLGTQFHRCTAGSAIRYHIGPYCWLLWLVLRHHRRVSSHGCGDECRLFAWRHEPVQ
jgi:hypothetical protein